MQRKRLGCGTLAVVLIVVGLIYSYFDTLRGSGDKVTPSPPLPSVTQTASRLETCVTDDFGGGGDARYAATWYSFIQGYRVTGDSVTVATSLFHKDENRPDAERIRGAVYSCAQSKNLPIRSVYVRASNDVDLAFGSVPGR